MVSRLTYILLILSGLAVCCPMDALGQDLWGDLAPGPHAVGLRMLDEEDPTRVYQGGPRPVRIYLWFPSGKTSKPAMRFRDYADVAALDFGSDRRRRFGGELLDLSLPFARSISEKELARLMSRGLRAVRDAQPAEGRFPLIVFGQGLDFESPLAHVVLCEYLASHGYVVATAPLLGVDSRLSGIEIRDVEAQIRDMEIVMGATRHLPFVDGERLGVAGFDLGGIAGLLLSMRNPEVKALVTLDCAVQFDDDFLKVPHESPDFDPARLRAAWLDAISEAYVHDDLPDLENRSLFAHARYSNAYFVWVYDAQHSSFTSYSMLGLEGPLRGWPPFAKNARRVYESISSYVRAFFNAHLRDDPRALAFLRAEPEENVPAGVKLSVRRREAVPASPSADDLINTLFEKGVDDALALARSGPAGEGALAAAGYKVHRAGETEWAVALFELNADLYPGSARAYERLGDAYAEGGEIERAIGAYERSLTLEPEAGRVKYKLKQLETVER